MTCTSRPQAWGQGTTKRKPGIVRKTDYPSRKSLISKSNRDPRARQFILRLTPIQRRNFLISELQMGCQSEETVMTPHYEDFEITDDYSEYIGAKCCEFLQNLHEQAVGGSFPCMLLTSRQSEDENWHDLRSWMVTAFRSKRLVALTTSSAKSSYLTAQLWHIEPTIVTTAMDYGIANKPVAKVAYLIEVRKDHPNSSIIESGLWALRDYPQLGCSPDGLVEDEVRALRVLEIKCLFILKDHDPNSFESVLNKAQMNRFFLSRDHCGNLCLKQNHEYYFQIQDTNDSWNTHVKRL